MAGLPLALLLVMVGALPMLLSLKTSSASNSSEIWVIALLPPGLSIGAALAFAWLVRAAESMVAAPRIVAQGAGALGGLGFAAMLMALAVFEQIILYTVGIHCTGRACMLGYVIFAFLGVLQLCSALFGLLLAMFGAWLASFARGLSTPRVSLGK